MSFEKISKLLKGDTPGRSVELNFSRIGPDDAARRCICQKNKFGFLMGLSIPEVALISGHKDTRMLMRYTYLRVEDLVER